VRLKLSILCAVGHIDWAMPAMKNRTIALEPQFFIVSLVNLPAFPYALSPS